MMSLFSEIFGCDCDCDCQSESVAVDSDREFIVFENVILPRHSIQMIKKSPEGKAIAVLYPQQGQPTESVNTGSEFEDVANYLE